MNDKEKFQPNFTYYAERPIKYAHIVDKQKLGDFGKKLELPCGGTWIAGKDFALQISYAANTYYELQTVVVFHDSDKKWHELMEHLLFYRNTLFTRKPLSAVLGDLGLEE